MQMNSRKFNRLTLLHVGYKTIRVKRFPITIERVRNIYARNNISF